MVKNLPVMQETRLDPWVGKIPWKKKWLPTPVFLPGEFHAQRGLTGYSPWGHKELDMTERLKVIHANGFIFSERVTGLLSTSFHLP